MVLGADGRKRSHTFHRILMRSAAKLSYQQAQAAIDGNPDDKTGPLLEPLILRPLWDAYECHGQGARDQRQATSTSTRPSARSCLMNKAWSPATSTFRNG